jgi:TonB family protein
MKKLTIIFLLILSVIFMNGCSKRAIENNAKTNSEPQTQNSLQKQKTERKGSNNLSGIGFAVDIYKLEAAYAISKNWAFSGKTTESNALSTMMVFKVMPDGKIVDIKFFKKSGNDSLDESAYNAIKKASPLEPLPDSILEPYVEMGLRFTPNVIK